MRCALPSVGVWDFFEMSHANLYILMLFGVVYLFFFWGGKILSHYIFIGEIAPSPPGSTPMGLGFSDRIAGLVTLR